jgi:hypothetical protein
MLLFFPDTCDFYSNMRRVELIRLLQIRRRCKTRHCWRENMPLFKAISITDCRVSVCAKSIRNHFAQPVHIQEISIAGRVELIHLIHIRRHRETRHRHPEKHAFIQSHFHYRLSGFGARQIHPKSFSSTHILEFSI